jgi:triacylglycerol lipase
LYITGISLGGGLSVISFADINKSKIFDDVQVINYGSPRVANKNYADYFDNITQKRSKRFVVKGDPIPVMPECLTPLCNYKHTGNQYVCVNE